MGGDDNQRHLLVADPEDLKLGNHHSQLSADKKLTFETITVPIDRILIFPKRVYVLSQACYENLGPWGKDVYYHTGALPIRKRIFFMFFGNCSILFLVSDEIASSHLI